MTDTENGILLARIDERLSSLTDKDIGTIPAILNQLKILNGSVNLHASRISVLETKANWMPSRNKLLTAGVSAIVLIGGLIYALFKAFTQRG